MDIFLTYLKVFSVGGALCLIAQILVVRTKLTPARILVIFLIAGIILEAFGVFKYLADFAQAGATLPIMGFGSSLAKTAIELARTKGFLGALEGGFSGTGVGLGATIFFSFIAAIIFSPRTKRH